MSRLNEIILFLSIGSLHMASFLVFGNKDSIVSVDNLFMILGLIMVFTSNKFVNVKLTPVSKYVLNSVIVLIVVIPFFIFIKDNIIFGDSNIKLFSILRAILRIYLIICFIKYLSFGLDEFKRGLNFIMLFGVIIVLSMLFVDFFISIGFKIRVFGDENDNVRIAGITDMNVNANGAMLAILFGVCLKLQFFKIISSLSFFIYASFFVIGIFLSGSRTALGIAAVLYLLHMKGVLNTLSGKVILLNIFAFVFMIIIFSFFSSYTLSRIQEASENNVGYGGLGYRITYWEMYIDDIRKNLITLLSGNVARPTYGRSVHNFYIHTVFYSGLIFITMAFRFLIKAYKLRKKHLKNNNLWSIDPLFILIPQLMFWMTGTENITWFAIIMLLSTGVFLKYKKSISENVI